MASAKRFGVRRAAQEVELETSPLRKRSRKLLRRAVLCLLAGIAAATTSAWIASITYSVQVLGRWPSRVAYLSQGSLELWLHESPDGRWMWPSRIDAVRLRDNWWPSPDFNWWTWRYWKNPGWFVEIECPVWPFAAVSWAAFAAVMFRRRRRRTGVCPNCGYSLTGLTMPRCPECGSMVQLPMSRDAIGRAIP